MDSSQLCVVFRCDASAGMGGGHVVRCMALAQAFRQVGASVRFCVSDSTLETVPELKCEFPDSVAGFGVEASDAPRLASAFGTKVDVIVIDHYDINIQYEIEARNLTTNLLVIDDFPNRPHAATHLVDTTHGRRAEEYSSVVEPDTALMCGSSFAMLRPAFRSRRPSAPTSPHPSERSKLLVTFGMTDALDISGLTVVALSGLRERITVTFVLGSAAPHLQRLRRAIEVVDPTWNLVVNADANRMAELTAEADLILGAPGSASYERCCLGKPTLLVQFADNQVDNARSMVRAGAARLIGVMPGIQPDDIRKATKELLDSPSLRKQMSLAAFRLTDGDGASRIVAAVLKDISDRRCRGSSRTL